MEYLRAVGLGAAAGVVAALGCGYLLCMYGGDWLTDAGGFCGGQD